MLCKSVQNRLVLTFYSLDFVPLLYIALLVFHTELSPLHLYSLSFSRSIDDDECLVENAGCSDICTNTEGTYVCSCFEGYSLLLDKHNCAGRYKTFKILICLLRSCLRRIHCTLRTVKQGQLFRSDLTLEHALVDISFDLGINHIS